MSDAPNQQPADAMEALQDQARVEKFPRMPAADGGGDRDDARRVAVENINRYLNRYRVKRGELAQRAGLSIFTVRLVLQGRFREGADEAIRKMEAAIGSHLLRQDAPSAGEAGFVMTAVAREIFAIVKTTDRLQRMAAFYEESGAGKSMALRAVMRGTFPNGVLMVINDGCARPRDFLRALVVAVKKRGRVAVGTRAEGFNLAVSLLAGSRRLIAIDEADNLHLDSLNIIRQLHDATGCPVVLAGRPPLAAKLRRTMADSRIGGSIRGRMCIEYSLSARVAGSGDGARWLFSEDEVIEILRRYRVRFTTEAARWLCGLANLTSIGGQQCELGALRYAVAVFEVAILLAKGQEITRELVIQANRLCRGDDVAGTMVPEVEQVMRASAC